MLVPFQIDGHARKEREELIGDPICPSSMAGRGQRRPPCPRTGPRQARAGSPLPRSPAAWRPSRCRVPRGALLAASMRRSTQSFCGSSALKLIMRTAIRLSGEYRPHPRVAPSAERTGRGSREIIRSDLGDGLAVDPGMVPFPYRAVPARLQDDARGNGSVRTAQ